MRVTAIVALIPMMLPGCVHTDPREAEFKRKQAEYHAEEKRKESLPLYRQQTFDPAEHESYKLKGTAALTGEAFLRTRGGDVRYAAGQDVFLVPATRYGKEYIEKDLLAALKEKIPPLDSRIFETIRSVRADSRGRFALSDLPSGEYIVFTAIYWDVPRYSRYGSYSTSTGGPVWQLITLRDGEQKTMILTQ